MRTIHKIVLNDVKPHLKQLFIVLMLMLVGVALEALAPWPFKFLIDNVLSDSPLPIPDVFQSRLIFGMVIVMIFFLTNIFLHLEEFLKSVVLKRVIRDIIFSFSRIAFKNIEHVSIGFYRTQEVGDYIYKLNNDVSALGSLIEDGVLPIITSSLYVIVTTTILFFIDRNLALISVFAIPFLAGGLYLFNRRIVLVSNKSEHWNSLLYSFVQETLSQLKIIQAFNHEESESKEFDHKMHTSLIEDFKLQRLNYLLSLVVGVIIALSYTLIIGIGIDLVFRGEISTGLLLIFIFYLDNLTTPVISIIYAVASFKENFVRVNHMSSFFTKQARMEPDGELTTFTRTNISFERVTLRSRERHHILSNITLNIPENKLTVIVGVSGSGKTSLISMIPRLIDEPTYGYVRIGKYSVRDYKLETLRDHISLVPQETILFNDTIANNIRFGKPNATIAEIRQAAKDADALHFIDQLSDKFDFKVGENGNFLSGGQRQRLAIARALIKKPDIYIFDEPLSALDISTRKQVWDSIQRLTKGKTTIIVTNILDVISEADLVVTMSEGKIVKTGSNRVLQHASQMYKLTMNAE